MKLQFPSREKRPELAAVLMVASILAVGAFAKIDAVAQLSLLAH